MTALLLSFLLALLVSTGDRPQLLAAVLAERFANPPALLGGAGLASIVNAAFSAFAGSYIGAMMGDDARLLMLALALLLAGGGMISARWISRKRPLDQLESWRSGTFLTGGLGIGILQAGDKLQFLLFAIAAFTTAPLQTMLGGGAGMMIALAAAIMLGARIGSVLPMNNLRMVSGGLLIIAGCWAAVHALGLV